MLDTFAKLLPMTATLGFVEGDAQALAAHVLQRERTNRWFSESSAHPVEGSAKAALWDMLPVMSPDPTKYLFLTCNGGWTTVVTNVYSGVQETLIWNLLRGVRGRGVRILLDPPHSSGPAATSEYLKGRFSSCAFSMWEPEGETNCRTVRVVSASRRGRGQFFEKGHPLPGEDTSSYAAKMPLEKFGLPQLVALCKTLGISFTRPEWYGEPGGARGWRVDLGGVGPPGLRVYEFSPEVPR